MEFNTVNAVDEVLVLRREKRLARSLGLASERRASLPAALMPGNGDLSLTVPGAAAAGAVGAAVLFRPMRSPSVSRPSSAVDCVLDDNSTPLSCPARPHSASDADGRMTPATPIAVSSPRAACDSQQPHTAAAARTDAGQATENRAPASDAVSTTAQCAVTPSSVWSGPLQAVPARDGNTAGTTTATATTHARAPSRSRRPLQSTPNRR